MVQQIEISWREIQSPEDPNNIGRASDFVERICFRDGCHHAVIKNGPPGWGVIYQCDLYTPRQVRVIWEEERSCLDQRS